MTEQLNVDIAAGSEQFSEEVDRYDGAMNSAFREALVLCTDDEFRCKIYYLNALYCLNQLQGRQMALAAMVQDETDRDYYKHRNGVKSFPFPGDNWNTTMTTVIDEIWNLIKELYSDMIKP